MIRQLLRLLEQDDLLSQAAHRCDEMLELCQAMVTSAVHTLSGQGESPAPLDVDSVDTETRDPLLGASP